MVNALVTLYFLLQVDAVNDEGYSPILLGFVHCMNLQYNSIDLKKKHIHQALSGRSISYQTIEMCSVDLRYNWQFWVSFTYVDYSS